MFDMSWMSQCLNCGNLSLFNTTIMQDLLWLLGRSCIYAILRADFLVTGIFGLHLFYLRRENNYNVLANKHKSFAKYFVTLIAYDS